MKKILVGIGLILLSACMGMPQNVSPIEDLNINKYLGQWYEIARLDHSFERGLSNVSASYSLRDDGGVDVINRGFVDAEKKWSKAQGKAYFVKNQKTGHLKVSFFGPFYSSYVIFEIDEGYQYAFVSGYNNSYLWLLARTPKIEDEIKIRFIKRANDMGFDTKTLIFVKHDK